MLKKLNNWSIGAYARVRAALTCERGDTNFISILIVLGIVIALSIVFLAMKDTIVEKVQGQVDKLRFE